MIQFNCDRCERPFELTDDRAGEKLECPDCGDMNIVPAAHAPEPPPSESSDSDTAYDPNADRAAARGLST